MEGERISVDSDVSDAVHSPPVDARPDAGPQQSTPNVTRLEPLIRAAASSAPPALPDTGSGGRISLGPRGRSPAVARASNATPKIQPKLEVGTVDDPYEREADEVATRVVRATHQRTASTSQPSNETDRIRRSARSDASSSTNLRRVPTHAHGVVVRPGHPAATIRRAPGDDGEDDQAALGTTMKLLEVAQRLVDDLEGHRRGWLVDLKPKRLFDEVKKVEKQIELLLASQGRLQRLVNLGETMAAYDRANRTMVIYKQYMFGTKTAQYKTAKASRKEIEKSLGVSGFKKQTKVRKKLDGARSSSEELREQLDATTEQIIRLRMLATEIVDRAVARGVQIEELARSRGVAAPFPFDADLEAQMSWLEKWMDEFPEVRESAREEISGSAESLAGAKEVLKTEKQYVFSSKVYQELLTDYAALTKPGTSMNQSVKFTFTFGEGVEAGFYVKVAGAVATGDDRKIRPKLSFTVAGIVKADLGIWDASASIGLTFSMVQGFDGLEHFAAHYMRVLSLYDMSFRNFWQLRHNVDGLEASDPDYREKRNEMIKEAASRGFVASGDTIEVGDEDQAELAAMQAKPPVDIRAVNISVDAGIAPNDNATGALAHFGGVTFSASYTRKWFTRLVDYATFVEQNDDVDEELTRLLGVRSDYEALLRKLERVRGLIKMAVIGGVPPDLRAEEAELARLKNIFEEGHLTFCRRGRAKFRSELNGKIEELQRDRAAEAQPDDVEGVAVDDIRSAEKNKKKRLTKTGSVYEVAIGGSAKIGGLAVTLGGKYNAITNDANPDNDGKYLNLSLEAATNITGEILDPESDAGQKALDKIADAGSFQEASTAATGSAVTATLLTNLAGSVESITGVLAGSVKVEINLVWSNGWFRTQYVRVTRSRSHSMELKAKTGVAGNFAVAYEGGRSDFVTERLGGNTFSYVLTVYQGMRKHKDFASEWSSWKRKHKNELWTIGQQVGLSPTPTRSEFVELPGGQRSANSVSAITSPLFAQRAVDTDFSGSGDLPFDAGTFARVMAILEGAMEREFEARSSLDRGDLTRGSWSSAEGTLDSVITIPVKLGQPTAQGHPRVASKTALTRLVKGSADSVEDLTRFGTLGGLFDAGATLQLELSTGGSPSKVNVTVPNGADLDESLTTAAKTLVKAISAPDVAGYTHWSGSSVARTAARDSAKQSDLIKSAKFDLDKVLELSVPA